MITLLSNNETILLIALPIAVLFVIGVIFLLYSLLKKKKKNKIKEEGNDIEIDDSIYFIFGGKDNIKNIELKGSRLVIELIDQTKFDRELIKEKGIDKLIVMSNKITLVGDKVNEIYSLFNK